MSRRIAQSSVNWAALTERVPAEQRGNLISFKARSDKYLRRVLSNPAEAPKIDWAVYKQTVPIPGMVDTFQKQYESLKIPYPQDTQTAQIEAQWAHIRKSIEAFVAASNSNIAEAEKEIAHIRSLLPYDQMTMEDYRDAYPNEALDPLNKPTFWPHDAEEQMDYVDPDKPAQVAHH